MPDFNFKPSFPIAEVINAAQRKAQIEQQGQQFNSQQMQSALQGIGEVGKSLVDQRRKVAQALALGKQFGMDENQAKLLDPDQILKAHAIDKGAVDLDVLTNAARLMHGGVVGTPQASATPTAGSPTQGGATLASQTTTTPLPASPALPIVPPPSLPTPSAPTMGTPPMVPTPQISTGTANGSMAVPIAAPPAKRTVNAATANLILKTAAATRPDNVYSYDNNGKLTPIGQVPKGSTIERDFRPAGGEDFNDPKVQMKLEKQYQDMKLKALSNRSGGLGLEDQKVGVGIHLRKAINTTYDPKTGDYKIPPSMHAELVIGLARMLSNNGIVGEGVMQELRQRTKREGAANVLISFGFDPTEVGGTTQSVAKFFVHQLDRQAQTAEENRQGYMDYIRGQAPTGLNPETIAKHDKVGLNSYSDLLMKSPDYKNSSINLGTSYTDPEKEKRYQEWKKNHST